MYNAALWAATVASSSADDLIHGVAVIADARSIYWASRLATSSPEELSVDFGFSARVQCQRASGWRFSLAPVRNDPHNGEPHAGSI